MPKGKLTYAGVPLVSPSRSYREFEARWNDLEAPDLWAWPAYTLDGIGHLPIPDRPKQRKARLNTLVWPTGASRWAVFHALVGDANAKKIQDAVGQVAPTPQDLIISDGTNTLTVQMHLLDVRAVFSADGASSPGLDGGSKGKRLWHITLVDARYFWWMRDPTSYTFSATWSTLLTNLVTAASGISPTVPTVPGNYQTANLDRWQNLSGPLPLVIDAAATSVGFRFVRDPDGTLRFVTSTGALADDLARRSAYETLVLSGGGNAVEDEIGNVPAAVKVGFGTPPSNIQNITLAGLSLPEYGSSTGVANTSGWIFGDLPASTLSGTLFSYAVQAATDYYYWSISYTDAVYRGVLSDEGASPITGLEDRVEWDYTPGIHNAAIHVSPKTPRSKVFSEKRVVTRVVRRDLGDRNVYGTIPGGDCCWWSGGYYVAQMLHVGNSAYPGPTYPLNTPSLKASGGGTWLAGTGTTITQTLTDSLVVIPAGTGYVNVRGTAAAFFRTTQGLPVVHNDLLNGFAYAFAFAGIYQVDSSNNDLGRPPLWYGIVCNGQYMSIPEYFVGHVAATGSAGVNRFCYGDLTWYDYPTGWYSIFSKQATPPDLEVYAYSTAEVRLAWIVGMTKSVDNWDVDWHFSCTLEANQRCCPPADAAFPGMGPTGTRPKPIGTALIGADKIG